MGDWLQEIQDFLKDAKLDKEALNGDGSVSENEDLVVQMYVI